MVKQLTIATYNIEFSQNPELLVKSISYLQKQDVEVICLQEVMKYPNKKFILDKMLHVLGTNWKHIYFIGRQKDLTGHGVAILWNNKLLKLESSEKLLLPQLKSLSFLEQLFTLAFKIIHSPRQKERKAIIGTFRYKNQKIKITSLHLDLVGGISHRIKQAEFVLNHLKNDNVAHKIICGDFNTIDPINSGIEKKIMQDLFNKFSFNESTMSIDWTADLYKTDFKKSIPFLNTIFKELPIHMRRKIDFIWIKGFHPVQVLKVEKTGSDHFPIIATLKT